MRNSLILLNENGDTTISWDESNDEKMIAVIQKKMDQGMTFFVVKPRMFGLIPMKIKAKSATDALENRTVIVKDSDFNDLILDGAATAYKRQDSGELEIVKKVNSAREVVRNHVIGVNRRVGG